MRIFIPTKNRPDKITTHTVFAGCDYTVIVHDNSQLELYLANSSIDPNRIIVSNTTGDVYGLTRQREWICDNLVKSYEWFIFADDNVKSLTALPEPYYNYHSVNVKNANLNWSHLFSTICTVDRFFEICYEMIELASRIGAHWCGFASNSNHFFRGKKYRTVGYVIGKMTLSHNIGVKFDHTISMEDFNNTAEQLLLFGNVLINNFVFPTTAHYQSGGMGTYEERIPYRLRDCKLLMEKFPGLFRYKNRKGFVPNTDLAIRFTSQEQVDRWRRSMGII